MTAYGRVKSELTDSYDSLEPRVDTQGREFYLAKITDDAIGASTLSAGLVVALVVGSTGEGLLLTDYPPNALGYGVFRYGLMSRLVVVADEDGRYVEVITKGEFKSALVGHATGTIDNVGEYVKVHLNEAGTGFYGDALGTDQHGSLAKEATAATPTSATIGRITKAIPSATASGNVVTSVFLLGREPIVPTQVSGG